MKISSALLNTGYLYPLMQQTLQMYLRGEDLAASPIADWGRKTLAEGKWWYGAEKLPVEEGIRMRLAKVVELYESIRKDGFSKYSVITVNFDAEGNVKPHDGFHRLCILKFLGQTVDVECRIKQDFPLLQTLQEVNHGCNLYQPVEDAGASAFNLWRPDSYYRLKLIRENLLSGDVADLGCDTGFFCRGLADVGFNVTGVEVNPKRAAVARYLMLTQSKPHGLAVDSWQHYLSTHSCINVLLLSVLHHDAIKYGVTRALDELRLIRGKCKRLIIEFPLCSDGVTWHAGASRWRFSETELVFCIEEATGLRALKVFEGSSRNRPLMIFGEASDEV